MFSAKPKTPRPTGCCAQQMKRFHSPTAGLPVDTNPVRGAAAPLTTPPKGFFDSLTTAWVFSPRLSLYSALGTLARASRIQPAITAQPQADTQ